MGEEKQLLGYGYIDEYGNGSSINTFDMNILKSLADSGFKFVKAYSDGSYEYIDYTEIKEPPKPEPILLPVISHKMWQSVMEPLRALMATTMQPATALMPLTIRGNINSDYNDFINALDEIEAFFENDSKD